MEELKRAVKVFSEATTTEEKKAALEKVISLLASEFKSEAEQMVQSIENDQFQTTKGGYGRYMAVLSGLSGLYRLAMVRALQTAGAGQGLNDALMVIGRAA